MAGEAKPEDKRDDMSALCKINGCLVLMSTATPQGDHGKCPLCKGVEFRWAPNGWVECNADGCEFAVLAEHLNRMPDDVESQIGAYI